MIVMRSITLFIILVFSFFMCACSEDSENSTGEAGMEQQMDAAPQDEMSSDMGADDMDPSDLVDMGEMPMDRGPMPEGEGELWHLQLALVEFAVEVPFQIELQRGDGQFDFVRIRATKGGMVSEPMNWVYNVPIADDGTFVINFSQMTIPGPFSPTLDDVDVTLVIEAVEADGTRFCGNITGEVITLETPVTMSTFGAVPWGSEAPFPSSCNQGEVTFDPIAECPMLMAGDQEAFPSAELDRQFRIFVPENYDPNVPTPLVIGYHGKNGAEWPWGRVDLFVEESELPTYANQNGSILVLMASQNLGSEWESGTYGPTRDLAFFDDVITCMKSSYNIDEDRIHVTGHSAGSYQAAMLTLTRADVIASSALASTGLLADYIEPEIKAPLIVLWGGEEDISFMQDFNRQTLTLIENFSGGGHLLLACQHHHLPLSGDNSRHTWQPPTNEWIFHFFDAHPKGSAASPYVESGVPEAWSDYCELSNP